MLGEKSMEPGKLIPDQIIGIDSKGNLIYQSGWNGSYYIQSQENKSMTQSIFASSHNDTTIHTYNSSQHQVIASIPGVIDPDEGMFNAITVNKDSNGRVRVVASVPELDRLLEYLNLDATERAFIKSAAQQPSDKSILMVFADYIEEKRNKYTEAARLRAVK